MKLLRMARLSLDDCVPLPLGRLLTPYGHDFTAAMLLGLRGRNDPFHLKYTVEPMRILITINQSAFHLLTARCGAGGGERSRGSARNAVCIA
jgi:hypothetical protein